MGRIARKLESPYRLLHASLHPRAWLGGGRQHTHDLKARQGNTAGLDRDGRHLCSCRPSRGVCSSCSRRSSDEPALTVGSTPLPSWLSSLWPCRMHGQPQVSTLAHEGSHTHRIQSKAESWPLKALHVICAHHGGTTQVDRLRHQLVVSKLMIGGEIGSYIGGVQHMKSQHEEATQ